MPEWVELVSSVGDTRENGCFVLDEGLDLLTEVESSLSAWHGGGPRVAPGAVSKWVSV